MAKLSRQQLLIQMIWLVLVDSKTWPNSGTCVLIWNLERNKEGQVSRSCQSVNLHFNAVPKRTADVIKTCVGGTWSGSNGSSRVSGSEVITGRLPRTQRGGENRQNLKPSRNRVNGKSSRQTSMNRRTSRKQLKQTQLKRQMIDEEMRKLTVKLQQIRQHAARLISLRRRANRRQIKRQRVKQRQMARPLHRQSFRQTSMSMNGRPRDQVIRRRQRLRQHLSDGIRKIPLRRRTKRQGINQVRVNRRLTRRVKRLTQSSGAPSIFRDVKLHMTISKSGQNDVTDDTCLLKRILTTCGFSADVSVTPTVVKQKDWVFHSNPQRPQTRLKQAVSRHNNRKRRDTSSCQRSVLRHVTHNEQPSSPCKCPGGRVDQSVTSSASSVTATVSLQPHQAQAKGSTRKTDTSIARIRQTPRKKVTNQKTRTSPTSKQMSEIKLSGNTRPKSPVTPIPGRLEFDYYDALEKSMMFYFAQRSGPIYDRIIPWRTHPSAMSDGSDVHRDLVGGWYDAGDHVKFNFPMAASTTILLWGFLKWGTAYQAIGKTNMMYMLVKHPLDYFLKCWDNKNKILYAQVGDAHIDHFVWGRPEDMKTPRPTFYLNVTRGGSDLAAEMAAALAAGSMAFRVKDPSYSSKLLKAAEEIYDFADSNRGKYDLSIPRVVDFYKSWSGFYDELCWGAAWLLRATGKEIYRAKVKIAMRFMDQHPVEFSWDSKSVGCYMLMYRMSSAKEQNFYRAKVIGFMDDWVNFKGPVKRTPCGLAWLVKWGSLRYAANTALIGLIAADDGIKPIPYRIWAEKQIKYILGANSHGFSFQVGFGNHFPLQPHHPAASCPLRPAPCDWETFKSPAPNPHELTGALVGGPDRFDDYVDLRSDFVKNEVTTDYNAGFQSALAALIDLHLNNKLPNARPECRRGQRG